MRILAIDAGTGTQDVLVYDSELDVENAVKIVAPAPTMIAADRIRATTRRRRPLLLTGVTAGGGPCHWALTDHLTAGLEASATPAAARTFNDDLTALEREGLRIVSDDEAAHLNVDRVELRDIDLASLRSVLDTLGVSTRFDGLAVGVLDHGAAPPGESDRAFRFAHIQRTLERDPDVRAFASEPAALALYLTRARAVASSAEVDGPTVVMDSGAAAALGALHDAHVARSRERMVLNLGNMHTLGFLLDGMQVSALFEHHTGECAPGQIARMAQALIDGRLTNAEVFEGKGHGAWYADRPAVVPTVVAVTGPRRSRLGWSGLGALEQAYFAAPHGDMMLSGCFGLLEGFAYRVPEAAEVVGRLRPESGLGGCAGATALPDAERGSGGHPSLHLLPALLGPPGRSRRTRGATARLSALDVRPL